MADQLTITSAVERRPAVRCERFHERAADSTSATLNAASARSVAEIEATNHEGNPVTVTTDETILYAFPNHDGCRCSAQVQQYEQLHQQLDSTAVYGLAPATTTQLAELAEKFNVTHDLLADPHGKIARSLGLEFEPDTDRGPQVERATLFIKQGEIVDSVTGMHGITITDDGGTIEVGEEPRLIKQIQHPSVVTIVGKRGAGKSSTSYWIGEQLYRHKGVTPTTVAMPEHVRSLFPSEWVHVDAIEEAPPDSAVIVDEAYRMLHAREWQKNDSVAISKLINLSRQCDRTIVFVSQSTKQIDGNVPLESDAVVVKEPGALHERLERREMRPVIEEANQHFNSVPKGNDLRGYAYLVTDNGTEMVQTREAEFFKNNSEALSNAFGGVCGSYRDS